MTQAIVTALRSAGTPMSTEQLASALNADRRRVGQIASDLYRKGDISRVQFGVYSAEPGGKASAGKKSSARKAPPKKVAAKKPAKRIPARRPAVGGTATVAERGPDGQFRELAKIKGGALLLEDGAGQLWVASKATVTAS